MKNRKNIIVVIMFAVILFMITVYAIFQTNLNISSTGNITTTWDIDITKISSSFVGSAYDISIPTYSGTTATFAAGLYKPGDRADYSITVTNSGTIDAVIGNILFDTKGSDYIVHEVSGIQKGQTINKQESITFTLSVKFDENATIIPSDKTKDITMSIICVQPESNS